MSRPRTKGDLMVKRCRTCRNLFETPARTQQDCYPCKNAKQQKRNDAIKAEARRHYGEKCMCPGGCDEARVEFLVIDHIDNNGAQHRRELKEKTGYANAGSVLCYWLKKQGWPPGFRTLCANCNMSLGKRGYCPHEKEKRDVADEKPIQS